MSAMFKRALVWFAALFVLAGLCQFYLTGATEHAVRVNTGKERGDQSAYLAEAILVYRNWHGLNQPPIVQPRNRMPLYPAYLATRYDPRWTDPEFFEHAKNHSIQLSVVLLVILALVVRWHVSFLPAASLMLCVTFGYFIFRAGYTQAELLYYTLHFLAFVGAWHLLEASTMGRAVGLALAAGLLAGLAHLTKAATLPMAVLVVIMCLGDALVNLVRTRRPASLLRPLAAGAAFAAAYLLVLYPYIATSKRIHGQYFYTLSSVMVWYDNYPQAAAAWQQFGPDGWPPGRRSDRPGASKYLREHTVAQIASRFGSGFRDMAMRSYHTFWYLKFAVLYMVVAAAGLVSFRLVSSAMLERHWRLVVFLLLYAGGYAAATAFYEPISGTGTSRFVLAHVAPLLFALTMLFESRTWRARQWSLAGTTLTMAHVYVFTIATILLDVTFTLWYRLLTTYGGF